jgi:cytochrome b pre-mRNA-processing protein 3
MLKAMRRSKERRLEAGRIYAALVARAREPVFFERFDVPDTLDGRFDLLTLHAWLVLQRLKPDAHLSQGLVDTIFVGFEEALRELGTGDIGLGRRMKKFADAFYGRLQAYGAALDQKAMEAALTRNLYRGNPVPGIAVMAAYVLKAKDRLASVEGGTPEFGPLPDEEQT